MNQEEQEDDDQVLREISAFQGDKRLKTELENYLKFVFEQEYKMLLSFYPNHELLVDQELQKKKLEQVQSAAQKQVYVDINKVADNDYLN